MKNILYVLLIIPSLVLAQIPEPQKGTYVNDQYGYLQNGEKQIINRQLRAIEDSTGVQVAIVLIPALPDRYDIEDYAREIGRKWHVGNAKNGIVYVAAIDQHKHRLEIASHLEGYITDIAASRLLADIKPYFRAQKYGDGLINLATQLQVKLNDPDTKAEQKQLTSDELKKKADNKTTWWMWLGMFLGFTWVITFIVFRSIKNQRLKKLQQERERQERLQRQREKDMLLAEKYKNSVVINSPKPKMTQPPKRTNTYSDDPALIIVPPDVQEDYIPPSRSNDDYSSGSGGSYSSDSSSSSSSSDSGSSSYGDWGGGSSDTGSSSADSGYSGGGASDSW